jgi:uroporphyrinogen-III decarboxylase
MRITSEGIDLIGLLVPANLEKSGLTRHILEQMREALERGEKVVYNHVFNEGAGGGVGYELVSEDGQLNWKEKGRLN